MKRIKFLDTNWPADHPVYRLMHDHVPEGWGFCGAEAEADLEWVGTMGSVEMLMSQMVRLCDNRDLLRRLGRSAHDYVNDVHPVARTRRMLGEIYRNAL